MSLSVRVTDPVSRLTGLFEDDGRTADAYIQQEERVVADVWIYNHGPAPAAPEWKDARNAPFRNPARFAGPAAVEPAASGADVRLAWEENARPPALLVRLRGELCARRMPGARPGWSRFAAVDGPRAKVLPPSAP
jgi:hypothetical protein